MASLKDLQRIMDDNDEVVRFLSAYINLRPRFLTREMVENLAQECEIDCDTAFRTLFSAACGLDTVDDPHHRALEKHYLLPGVQRLEPELYRNDAYVQTVRFPLVTRGKWELCEHSYLPYEPFVRTHPVLTPDLREIPQIGYFDCEFPFPAVLEDGIEWMTVTPNEVETMREPIRASHGRVLTLGLGLGYFAFHASARAEVESVTVVERDPHVISLFRECLLPQFPHGDKIRIVESDAFDYMKQHLRPGKFDVVFSDLWHDPSDGLELYLELRKLEALAPKTHYLYWIEPSLLSVLRHMVFSRITDPASPLQLRGVAPKTLLSDDFLKSLQLSKNT